ncbi:hypothetical protein GQX74_000891 [Glossina fuscipes]|nr:hypothetical protein GQX74_000891 [Glossina fuscipes]
MALNSREANRRDTLLRSNITPKYLTSLFQGTSLATALNSTNKIVLTKDIKKTRTLSVAARGESVLKICRKARIIKSAIVSEHIYFVAYMTKLSLILIKLMITF